MKHLYDSTDLIGAEVMGLINFRLAVGSHHGLDGRCRWFCRLLRGLGGRRPAILSSSLLILPASLSSSICSIASNACIVLTSFLLTIDIGRHARLKAYDLYLAWLVIFYGQSHS